MLCKPKSDTMNIVVHENQDDEGTKAKTVFISSWIPSEFWLIVYVRKQGSPVKKRATHEMVVFESAF